MSSKAGSNLFKEPKQAALSRRPAAIGLLTGLIALLVWALVVFG